MKKIKGITLITLVITVVVMLVLAGVTLSLTLGDDGIIGKAEKAVFVSEMKGYEEKVRIYVTRKFAKAMLKDNSEPRVRVGLENQDGIETVIPDIDDRYKDEVIVQDNVMYYKYTNNKKRVKWCFESGIPVWGFESWEDFILPKGEYEPVDGVYACAPDLTGFNRARTYFVFYDSNGNETIGNSIKSGPPKKTSDWYNYSESSKKWANIVTIGGDGDPNDIDNERSYFVWIPRYVYKLDKSAQVADVKFVDTNNYYKDYSDETQNATYSDTSPTYDSNGNQTNYCLPDAFTWDGKELPGFWVSKYEVSSVAGQNLYTDFEFGMTDTSISIINSKILNTSIGITSFEVYLNGESQGTTTQMSELNPFIIENLTPNTKYSINIRARDSAGNILDQYIEKVKTTERSLQELTKPNLKGYANAHTYYVTYDSNGTETIGDSVQYDSNGIPTNIPEGWYDYQNKKWANIVTIGGDGDPNNTDNDKAYFVWIPRYEYKTKTNFQEIQIRFISANQKNPNTQYGYQLPEAFKWDNKNISGFWVSKYEVSNVIGANPVIDCQFTMTDTSITIADLKVLKQSAGIASYEIFLNGTSQGTVSTISTSSPYTISNLTANTTYSIRIDSKNSAGNVIESYIERVKTTESSIQELTKPNLKGYAKDHTYYVTYDSNGTETIGSKVEYDTNGVPTNIPTGWYDYQNKKWANIVTIGGDGDPNNADNTRAYFTWIPRYEYKPKTNFQEIQIRFISPTQTTANTSLGYKLPEAFTWNGTPQSGFWVSKYEVSQ